jgi:hypothetical protein
VEPNILEPNGVSDKAYQKITQLAFQLYEARGRQNGQDVEDWLRAEAEIRSGIILPKSSIAASVYEE